MCVRLKIDCCLLNLCFFCCRFWRLFLPYTVLRPPPSSTSLSSSTTRLPLSARHCRHNRSFRLLKTAFSALKGLVCAAGTVPRETHRTAALLSLSGVCVWETACLATHTHTSRNYRDLSALPYFPELCFGSPSRFTLLVLSRTRRPFFAPRETQVYLPKSTVDRDTAKGQWRTKHTQRSRQTNRHALSLSIFYWLPMAQL